MNQEFYFMLLKNPAMYKSLLVRKAPTFVRDMINKRRAARGQDPIDWEYEAARAKAIRLGQEPPVRPTRPA